MSDFTKLTLEIERSRFRVQYSHNGFPLRCFAPAPRDFSGIKFVLTVHPQKKNAPSPLPLIQPLSRSAARTMDVVGPLSVLSLHGVQELCESRGGRPGLPAPNSPYGLCRRKATLNLVPQSSGTVWKSRWPSGAPRP